MPVEILAVITSLIDDTPTPTLAAWCSLVHSTFEDLVSPLLYKEMAITKSQQLPMFFRGIIRKPDRLRHLTSLIIKEILSNPFLLPDLPPTPDPFPLLEHVEFDRSIFG
jgi:hypothetical protein